MDDYTKISVCIPFYNLETYASRCLDSILNNTYKHLEVICVNDGSTDKTLDILRRYEKNDQRVVVVDKPNGGVVSARNAAIAVATGDFIAFIDGDDWVHHQYFEALLYVQGKTNSDVVICDYVLCTQKESESPIDFDRISYQVKSVTCVLGSESIRSLIWGRLFSRRLVSQLKDAEGINLGEDTIFNLSFLCGNQNLEIAILSEKLYNYYQRAGSLAHTIPHHHRIMVSRFFMMHFDKISGKQERYVVLQEIIRPVAAYRYLQMFSDNQVEVRETCCEIYNFCRDRWNEVFPGKDKVKYSLFYHCPSLYRLFRIVTDPTMLDWERAEKKRQQEQKQV